MTLPALRVLVVDDEAVARRRLVRLLSAMPDVEPAGECADGAAALARIREGGVDVVLLDAQMPGLSGIEALSLLPEDAADEPVVIFCTAHPDHAVAAFDLGAIDYLLKPIEPARLRKALDRARDAEARRRFAEELRRHREAPALDRLALPTRDGIVLLDPTRVSHARLDGELVTVHADNQRYFTDLPLGELERRLPADRFVRVHRRALLNMAHVARLEPTEAGGFLARVHTGDAVEVSRQAARALRRRLSLGG